MSREREKSDLGFGIKKKMKKLIKTRCCVYKLDRLARAMTWSLERPDTENLHSSQGSLARANNTKARSSERKLDRAKNSNPQVCNQTHARAEELSLERRTNKLARAKKSSLEPRMQSYRSILDATPRSSEEPKTWTATLGF